MPTYSIQDFKNGLDLRKSYVTAPAGSLRTLRNCFITSGSEIEKRTGFINWAAAPADSIGILADGGAIYVVVNGPSGVTEPTDGPPPTPGVLSLPFQETIHSVNDWDLFNGKFYIVLQGTTRYWHYYNQVLVTDPMATSSSVRTYGSKMYGVDGRLMRFSAINDPTKWTPPSSATNDGSGYFDLSSQDADSTHLIGLEVYYDRMAFFSNFSTQFWTLNADPAQNQFKQLLRSTGLLATNALTQFGNGDIMYLSAYGVRSLRVQNLTLTAGTTDVGTPIDEAFKALLTTHGVDWFGGAKCLIQPRTGRLFVVLPDRIFVLSTFQEPAITAWSVFDAPFGFADCCIADPWIVLRGSDNNIYLYGSDTNAYDNTQVEVITPALSCETPSKTKTFHSFDVGAEGTWTLSVGCDPNNQATEETVATFTGSTYVNQEMTMPEQSTHISLRFRTTDASRVRLGHVVLIYDEGEQL